MSGAPAKFAFDGSMSLRPTLKIEGTVAADAISLRRALIWGGQTPLPGGGFQRFALKAQTNVVGGTIALSSVNVELGGNSAEGVPDFRDRRGLDLTRARSPPTRSTSPPMSPPSGS